MPTNIAVCEINASDKGDWEKLWRGYLDFYDTSLPQEIFQSTWRRVLSKSGSLRAIGARDLSNGELTGIAHWLLHESAWTPKPICYLQDLFVAPDYRRSGTGRLLINAVADAARKLDCHRLYWLTQGENTDARALYDKIARFSGFIRYDFDLGKH
jgi:GNAT superfamily N-acetyltransferase